MNREWFKAAILVMWLALPVTAWDYWRVWDQLPARMAVHFDANWRPNGYTSREGALELGVGIMTTMLVLFTVTILIVLAMKPSSIWPVLVISCAVLGVCCYANYSIVDFNLKAQPAHSESVGTSKLFSSHVSSQLHAS